MVGTSRACKGLEWLMFHRLLDADERSSGASKRLSDRYGIPEGEVQNLLYGKTATPAADAPANPRGEPRMPTMVEKNNRWNPVSILGALLGVVGVLSLVVAIMLLQRDRAPELPTTYTRHMPPEMSQTPPPPPAEATPAPGDHMMMDSCCMPPKDKAANEMKSEEPNSEAPKATPKKAHRSVHHAAPKGFQTTNSMEAEEHLADLRAEGNSKAKIHTTTKNGVTTYTVR